MKKYIVIIKIDGETDMVIKNEKELAELWETDNECGIYDSIEAYDYINGKMTQVNVYDIACAYINEREEMRREYEEYTEYVNEYGYDYVDNFD